MRYLWQSFVIFACLIAHNASAQKDEETYSQVQYVGIQTYDGSQYAFDNLMDAVNQVKRVRCTSDRTNCAITVGTPYRVAIAYWKYPVRFTASMVQPGPGVTEDLVVTASFNCSSSWYIAEDAVPASYHCRRTRMVPPPCNCETANENEPAPGVGNPIMVSLQTKVETATDYTDASGDLSFTRTYSSDTGRWGHNWEAVAVDPARNNAPPTWGPYCVYEKNFYNPFCYRYGYFLNHPALHLVRPGNQTVMFGLNGGTLPSPDVKERAEPVSDGSGAIVAWQVTSASGDTVDTFSAQSGRLLVRRLRSGKQITLTYSDASTPVEIAPAIGLLLSLQDDVGRRLSFTYDSQSRIATMTDPDNGSYVYSYNADGDLVSVRYPDGKTRTYVYNETANTGGGTPRHILTGVIDENSDRYATFKYTGTTATTSMHANGVDKYFISPDGDVRNVADPLGTVSTYYQTRYTNPVNALKITQIARPSVTGSGYVRAYWTYDANLNVSSKTGFDGVVTNFTYDLSRNLETSRTEAVGTPEARTISTAWHAAFAVPIKIAEPKKLTIFTYDMQGRLLTRTEQATTDLTGAQGLNPTLSGPTRTWSWTYNAFGQILTATGPRTDVTDVITYTYDTAGNLATVTNPLGHVTRYSNYDNSGRVGRIAAPTGLITDFTYTPRGWLATRSVSDGTSTETTTFEYDGVGQVKKVTFPDGASLTYIYDASHRLTSVADSVGNTVTYTLDNAGNRTAEKTTDPGGALTRQLTRVYDTLSNMKQTTGAPQ